MKKTCQTSTGPAAETKPELILHIGSPKTGSSSLQWAFDNNRELLKKEGIFYSVPQMSERNGYELHICMEREFIEKIIGHEEDYKKWLSKTEQSANQICAQFQEGTYGKMLISEEMVFNYIAPKFMWSEPEKDRMSNEQIERFHNEIAHYKASRLKNLFSCFDIKIVCYLRRQDLFVESLYNQMSKRGRMKRIVNTLKTRNTLLKEKVVYDFKSNNTSPLFDTYYHYCFISTHFYETLNVWASVFGKENITVLPFEKNQLKQGLVKGFFIDILNIAPNRLTNLKEVYINERISRDVLEYVNEKKDLPRFCEDTDLIELSKKLGEVNRYQDYLTYEERMKLLEYHKDDNEKIAREYLDREDGRLFHEEINTKEPEPYPGLTDDKREVLDQAFKQLEGRNAIYGVKRNFFDIKSRKEKKIEDHRRIVKAFKVYSLTILIFSQRVARSIVRKILKL